MTTRTLAIAGAALASAALATSAGAQTIDVDTDGTSEWYGFVGDNPNNGDLGRIREDTVSGGVLSGIIRDGQGDPQLRRFTTNGTDNFQFDINDVSAITIRLLVDIDNNDVQDADAGSFLLALYDENVASGDDARTTNPPGRIASSGNVALTTDNAFDTYTFTIGRNTATETFDLNVANFTDDLVQGLRIDPVNAAAGSFFAIDSITFVPVPEPTAIAGLAGAGLLALRRRRA